MRPIHLRPRYVGLVFLGGTVGTAVREALSLWLPPIGGVAYTVLAINILGAFLLGWLLDELVRSGPDAGWRRLLRLGAGTGFLGGFTTYSALSVSTAQQISGVGVAYGVSTVVLGALATGMGIRLATARHHRRGATGTRGGGQQA